MNRIADLIPELASNCGSRILIAVAAYPRSGWTGELERIDHVLVRALSLLSEHGGRPFRVMHGQGVVLLRSKDDAVSLMKDISLTCVTPEVEVRSLIIHFTGARDADWLDDFLGDLSVRGNFGRFSQERVARLIDGQLVGTEPA